MDRTIVYAGSIPLDTDLLSTNRNAMIGLGALAAATIGKGPVIDGLMVQPAQAGGLAVDVGPGSLVSYGPLDQSAYGSLAADVTDNLVKMGINVGTTTLPLAAPTSTGLAVSYLIQAAFQELDANSVVLPYYNAANPAQPFLGAGNNGLPQPTVRTQRVALFAKAGAAAASGANVPPTPDPGWVGLAVVTIANGQTVVSTGNLSVYQQTRSLPYKLPDLRPPQALVFTGSAAFTVPANVTRVRATVVGGGGAGGLHATLPSGGGGAGATAQGWIGGLLPGAAIWIQVGAGGAPVGSPGNGGGGASSSFGPYITATGGGGGGGGTANVVMPGGLGGGCYGGDVQWGGACGTDAIPIGARGGDGGGNGGGRGTSGLVQGVSATAPGGGGGGGGSSAPSGLGFGANGGAGANGIVILEY